MSATRLYTFWVSHFSEKVRWCLQYEGVRFEERSLLPGPHVWTVRKLAPQAQVPALVHQDEALQGSSAILDAIPRLFGKTRLQPWLNAESRDPEREQRARSLEALADRGFGRAIQAVGYDALLRDPQLIIDLWSYRGPFWARTFYALSFPVLARFLRKGYCRSEAYVEESRQRFLSTMDETDRLLHGQPYLLGEQLTRPDIVVAALLSPFVRPKQHPMSWPEYPKPLEEFIDQQRRRPTFELASRLYREHRATARARPEPADRPKSRLAATPRSRSRTR